MKNVLYFLPAVVVLLIYGIMAMSIWDWMEGVPLIWVAVLIVSGFLLAKGKSLGALPGAALGVWCMGQQSNIFNGFWPGLFIAAFYLLCGAMVYIGKQRS